MKKDKIYGVTPNNSINMKNMQNENTKDSETCCELCGRCNVALTRHHLIPRSRHNKARTKRQFSRDEMHEDIAMLCRPCHSYIHRTFSNHELANYYHTIERIREHTDIEKFVDWIKKRPANLKVRTRR